MSKPRNLIQNLLATAVDPKPYGKSLITHQRQVSLQGRQGRGYQSTPFRHTNGHRGVQLREDLSVGWNVLVLTQIPTDNISTVLAMPLIPEVLQLAPV